MGSVYRYPKSVRDDAVARVRSGEKREDIARELGVCRTTIDNWSLDADMEDRAERARAALEAAASPARSGIHPALLAEVMGL